MFLQEHWLFTFEQNNIADYIPSMHYHIRSVDQYNNISPVERLRGHGGVATLWTKDLDPFVRRSEEGNQRILVTLFELPTCKICCINAYLPSGNSVSQAYAECIDVTHEIYSKYSQTHLVILAGDLNADIVRRSSIKELK